jgi:predicted anti-sigma-YlaC factor YlaD
MNCQLCKKESDNYREGKLSGYLKMQVEAHLHECSECSEIFRIESIAESIIDKEKAIMPASNLTDRIMDRIGKKEKTGNIISTQLLRVLRPALIMTSMAAAIFIGVMVGNIYKPAVTGNLRPLELSLMDDAAIESINILSIE